MNEAMRPGFQASSTRRVPREDEQGFPAAETRTDLDPPEPRGFQADRTRQDLPEPGSFSQDGTRTDLVAPVELGRPADEPGEAPGAEAERGFQADATRQDLRSPAAAPREARFDASSTSTDLPVQERGGFQAAATRTDIPVGEARSFTASATRTDLEAPDLSAEDLRQAETYVATGADEDLRQAETYIATGADGGAAFQADATRADLTPPAEADFQSSRTRTDLQADDGSFLAAGTRVDLPAPGSARPPLPSPFESAESSGPRPSPPPELPAAPAPPAARRMGEFVLEERLGVGGMGDVFVARRERDGLAVALKLLSTSMDDETSRRRFEREGQVMLGLSHPTIVRLVGRGLDEETRRPYLAMELVPGRDLGAILAGRPDRRLQVEEAVYVLERCARALIAAHDAGVIHRDVKPSNLLVTPQGEVKLTDFGIALAEDASIRLTLGALVGTPAYLAPEVLLGDPWSPAADAYGFGSLAFEALAGRPLFEGDSATVVLAEQITREPPDLGGLREDAPTWLVELVMALLRKGPGQRLSLLDVAAELAEHLPPVEALERLRRDAAIDRETRPLELSGGRVLAPGQVFHHYRIDEELGRGGMGVVFKAFHLGLKRPVALKVLAAGALASEAEQARFLREAEAAGALSHPAIVPVLDAGQHGGTYYLAMEFVAGSPLGQGAARARADLLRLFCELCGAVAHAHTRGVVHRDLKPDNVLVDAEGHPHVLDFGVAKRLDTEDEGLTTQGDVVGTLRYMSPEQAAGKQQLVDLRSDVYSLGTMLYEALCGQTPYRGSVQELLYQVHFGQVAPPSAHRGDLPWELDAICLKALERDPDERYQSALELGREVERFLAGEPIRARRATLLYRARKYVARNRGRAAAGVGAAVVVLGLLGGWAAAAAQARRERELAQERLDREEAARLEEARERVRTKVREAWAAFARGAHGEAASAFEAAVALTPPDELIAPGAELLAALPADATADLRPEERGVLRLTRERLRRWAALARTRETQARIEERLGASRAALERGDLELAAQEAVAASRLGGQAEAQVLSERIAQAFVARAQRRLEAGLGKEDLIVRRRELEAARKELEDAQRVVARVARAELGVVLRELGKLNELEQAQAVARAQRARAADLIRRGQLLLEQGGLEEARRAFEQALGVDARDAQAREGLLEAERRLRNQVEEAARAARATQAEALRREAKEQLLEGRRRHGLGELPEDIRGCYFAALERLRRATLLAPETPASLELRQEMAREFAAVLIDQGQAELARFVRRLADLPEQDPAPPPLPRDPHLGVVESIAASARAAYGTPVVFQRTEVFDALRTYVASQARVTGVQLYFEIRILGEIRRAGLHPQVYLTGIEVRVHDDSRNTVSPPRRVDLPTACLRPAAVDGLGRRVFRPFDRAQRLDSQPVIRQVEGIVQAMVRDAR
ncbi:MAG: protein kinase [Planctomycetota bacterium]